MIERGGEGHEERRDDLAAYALGALEPADAAELERHLADCEWCRARLRWLQPAVDVLPASVEQLTPPERLRDRLLTTVRNEAALEAEATPARKQARTGRRRDWGGFLLRPATAVAAVALIVVGVAAGYALRGGDDDTATTVAALAKAPGDMSAELVREGDTGTLHLRNMPELDRDEVYEVWVQRGDVMEPGTTFVASRDDSAMAAVDGLDGADAVLVTREPYGGSEQPTTKPLLEAPLS